MVIMKRRILFFLGFYLFPYISFSAENTAGGSSASSETVFWSYVTGGLCMAVASSVVALSQAQAARAALEGIGRNPSSAKEMRIPLILALALMEALCLFSFIVAVILISK